MKLQTKQIIAREFLLLTIVFLVGLITFGGTYIYNSIQQKKINSLTKTISTKSATADSLAKVFQDAENKVRNEEFIVKSYNEDGLPILKKINPSYYLKESDRDKLDGIVIQMTNTGKTENDIQTVVDDFKEKNAIRYDSLHDPLGILLPKNTHLFHLSNSKTLSAKDSINYQQSLNMISEIKQIETERSNYNFNILSFNNRIDLSLKALLISGIILFIIRYVIYGISWSIKTLRQKS